MPAGKYQPKHFHGAFTPFRPPARFIETSARPGAYFSINLEDSA